MAITIFKIFHLGRYIVGSRVAVKLNCRPYIQRNTSPNENVEYGYPLIKRNAGVSSRKARCLNFGLALHQQPYAEFVNSKGFVESAHMRCLDRIFAARRCDKYQESNALVHVYKFTSVNYLTIRSLSGHTPTGS